MFEVVFINDEKDNKYSFAIIKVDPEIKQAIENMGNKIYIGMSCCKITERYHLTQCYKCQRFGHKKESNRCPLYNTEKKVCLYCSADHASKECPVKTAKAEFKCNNCFLSDDFTVKSRCLGHTTTSNECPILQKVLRSTMDRTLGCSYRSGISKNCITT